MRILLVVCLFLSAVILSSCSLSPMKVRPMSTYTITEWPMKAVVAQKTISNRTLLVTTPMAAPGYGSARMVYVMIPYQLKSFGNHRWVAPPAELLLPLLANHLRETGYFRAVVVSPFTGAANYQLNTRLLTLQQEFLQPQSKVRLTIETSLINVTTNQVMATHLFEITVPSTENTPYAGVLATNQAAHTISEEIAQFVVRSISHRKKGQGFKSST